jgi:chemosensory pili system protein ChpA (sensor histidine kinase/response regulator)
MLSLEGVDRLSELELNSYLAGDEVSHRYGEHSYPLHSLGVVFGVKPQAADGTDYKPAALLFRSAEASAALQVDAIVGHQEIIVKPVGLQLRNVPGISGATVLGDGRVIVVLEPAALVRKLNAQTRQQMAAQVLQTVQEEKAQGRERLMAMVIDDSITMRKVTARFLGRHDVDVAVAKDGVEAVALLEEQVPDFIILDIEMPRMDGFEVVAHVRNQRRLKHLPIIMVTSRSGEKHRNRAAKLGVDDYLIKPYQEEELMGSIRKALRTRGLEPPF